MSARILRVTGLVQGVFFRDHAKQNADRLDIKGRVKNLDDGSVEIHAEGTAEALQELEHWCHQGSPKSRVEDVESNATPEEGCKEFEIWW